MVDVAFYLVTKEIAARSGVMAERYRTTDGRFILDNKDLSRIRLTSEELLNGLQGVEIIDERTAASLIARNNYRRGNQGEKRAIPRKTEETPVNEETENEETSEQEENKNNEEEVKEDNDE